MVDKFELTQSDDENVVLLLDEKKFEHTILDVQSAPAVD